VIEIRQEQSQDIAAIRDLNGRVFGHPEFYSRFGFRPARPLGISCEWDGPDEVFMILVLDETTMSGVTGKAAGAESSWSTTPWQDCETLRRCGRTTEELFLPRP
jgi:putative acetyltransferase